MTPMKVPIPRIALMPWGPLAFLFAGVAFAGAVDDGFNGHWWALAGDLFFFVASLVLGCNGATIIDNSAVRLKQTRLDAVLVDDELDTILSKCGNVDCPSLNDGKCGNCEIPAWRRNRSTPTGLLSECGNHDCPQYHDGRCGACHWRPTA